MRDHRVLVIHTIHQPLNNFWAVVAGRVAGVPVVVSTVHGTRSTLHRRRALMLDRVLGPRIDAVVALANMHRDFLVAEQGMNPSKVVVIPNGIDLGRFRGGSRLRRPDLGLPEGVPIASVLAVLRPEKAHDNFLRAAALVLRQFPSAHFVLIGDGPQREYLESLTQTLGLASCVHFLGRRDDIDQVLPLVDVSVLPSRTEAFPVSVLEAMATGRPVVATDVGALREMVSPGVTGLIVPPENVEELASAISRVFGDRNLANRLGQAGLAWVENYDVSRMVRRMESLFVSLLNEKAAQSALARA
jgi:glycosyltransferase involved in cell wall biosynthesis